MSKNEANLYIGLDLSTQALKLTAINDNCHVIFEESVHFDNEFGDKYGIKNGVITNENVVTCPTMMWVESIDLLLEKLQSQKFPFFKVKVISGAGQQHGSVYWSTTSQFTLNSLNPSYSLATQFKSNKAFTITNSPTWQDSSTSLQCKNLEKLIGGPDVLALISGSKGFERFTGNQISKICIQSPSQYLQTCRISLVSSFLASIFLGDFAQIDIADGSGMNLLDINTKNWDDRLLDICGKYSTNTCENDVKFGEELKVKLGVPESDGLKVLGNISDYFVKSYGFSNDCKIIPFTGDNPATLLSMQLLPGDVVISLGTSDTVLFYTTKPRPTLESHTLCHPINKDLYISMLCYKNGSLTREYVRDFYYNNCKRDNENVSNSAKWKWFNEILAASSPDPKKYGYYFVHQEIIPFAKGIYRFFNKNMVEDFKDMPESNIRTVVESQFMSMKLRIDQLLTDDRNVDKEFGLIKKVLVVGGASKNNEILQVLADVFGVQVWRFNATNSASLGAAIKARLAYSKFMNNNRLDININEMLEDGNELVAQPRQENTAIYKSMMKDYFELEQIVIGLQKIS
ncbi:actin-like ATPase domain-containing protein [Gigaspora margarita]|uniref:Xylulose kinase n=1 Tax=Gigaspora margarita TaxID=4874 RepID=A0A8H4AIP0_GIGMA|nr:actin-like ATPase domain-containing protein [Gigaspora margarita]